MAHKSVPKDQIILKGALSVCGVPARNLPKGQTPTWRLKLVNRRIKHVWEQILVVVWARRGVKLENVWTLIKGKQTLKPGHTFDRKRGSHPIRCGDSFSFSFFSFSALRLWKQLLGNDFWHWGDEWCYGKRSGVPRNLVHIAVRCAYACRKCCVWTSGPRQCMRARLWTRRHLGSVKMAFTLSPPLLPTTLCLNINVSCRGFGFLHTCHCFAFGCRNMIGC